MTVNAISNYELLLDAFVLSSGYDYGILFIISCKVEPRLLSIPDRLKEVAYICLLRKL